MCCAAVGPARLAAACAALRMCMVLGRPCLRHLELNIMLSRPKAQILEYFFEIAVIRSIRGAGPATERAALRAHLVVGPKTA